MKANESPKKRVLMKNARAKTLGRLLLIVGVVFSAATAIYISSEGHDVGVAAIMLIIAILISIINTALIFGNMS
ncbi:MAG: hypothetical protein QXP36_05000 [Conexivisphaerales archaeon]